MEQFGLNGKKADVYLASLELGSATVIEIAKKAAIKRTTTYDILQDLEKDGLVSKTAKGKKRLFIGEDPEKIKRDLVNKERLFSEILPQLKSIHNVSGAKPKIRFYEGVEGVKEVYNDTLKYSGEFVAFGSEDVVRILGKGWTDDFIKRRIKRGIHVRAIVPKTEYLEKEIQARDQEHLRITKLIDIKKYPFSIEIDIYGHSKIALLSSKEMLGVIIESTEVYNTLKLIFELLWDTLPEVERK